MAKEVKPGGGDKSPGGELGDGSSRGECWCSWREKAQGRMIVQDKGAEREKGKLIMK